MSTILQDAFKNSRSVEFYIFQRSGNENVVAKAGARSTHLVFPLGNLSTTLDKHFPSRSLLLFTIRFSQRPSGSETAVPRRDLFEWFPSQSGPLVFVSFHRFRSLLPLLHRFLLLLLFLPSSSLAFSRPIRIPLTDLGSKVDSHGRSDSLCTFQKCPEAAPGVNETRR